MEVLALELLLYEFVVLAVDLEQDGLLFVDSFLFAAFLDELSNDCLQLLVEQP